ncbi:MAG: hypothetical protein JWQ44_261 [Chthoniobacter sp.]|nr:hypothetical protein [Chthoniobacter sp.]
MSSSLIQATRRGGLISAGFYVVVGTLFVAWGSRDGMSFIMALGIAFLVFGIISAVRVLRIAAPENHRL